MGRQRYAGLILLIVFISCAVAAQSAAASSKTKLDRLIVYGDGFAFGVKEPAQWAADTDKLARHFHVNVVFTPRNAESENSGVTIRVRVNKKVDENTIEDLNYDMGQYKQEFPKAQFDQLTVTHPQYRTFARLVYVPEQFYEYVAYINPGPESKFTFSGALSKRGRVASREELEAFEEVLQSLVWLSSAPSRR